MSKKPDIWQERAAKDDIEAAGLYLGMLLNNKGISRVLASFRKCSAVMLEAKDVLRASDLPLLEKDDPKVAEDLKRIEKRKKLSPVLLVQGDLAAGVPMTIADGYHRVCASYYWDEKCPVACCVIALPKR